MNIFYLSSNVEEAAALHCNKHVVKMIVEYAQLLSTAHRVLDGDRRIVLTANGRKAKRWVLPDAREQTLYKATHANHPSAVWCRKTVQNYNLLHNLLTSLCKEYTHRYGKVHKVEQSELLNALQRTPKSLTAEGISEPPPAMPDYCKVPGSSVQSYRNYYVKEKKHFAKWTNRPVPSWFL